MAEKIDSSGYNIHTFVFGPPEEMPSFTAGIRNQIWQIFPTFWGALLCVSYGIMLGWPSPTYPFLIQPNSIIPITLDQCALIAGFIMVGNFFGTPFSGWSYFGSKYGIIFGLMIMTIGWTLMWYATSVNYLLGSRFMIGFGNGYGLGQLKVYIRELCEAKLAVFLTKSLNLFVVIGQIIAFSMGPFLSFRNFALVSTVITIVILFFSLFLPHTPHELVQYGKLKKAILVLEFLKPNVNAESEVMKLKHDPPKDMSFIQVLRRRQLRNHFFIFFILTFVQQFSGSPPSLIFCQIMFMACGCAYPEYCAIIYVLMFFISSAVGIFHLDGYNKKHRLLASTLTTSIILASNAVATYYKVNERFFNLTSLFILLPYIFCHTVGLGSVPAKLMVDLFPPPARRTIGNFYFMFLSALALTITKLFQLTYTRFGIYVPFLLFMSTSLFGFIFTLIFIPSQPPVLEDIDGA